MEYFNEYEYQKLWEEIRNEWDLNDFLKNEELSNILENDHLIKYHNTIAIDIENITNDFCEEYTDCHFLDNIENDFNEQIINAVYMFMNKNYDEDLIKNDEKLMFKLLE